MKPKRKPKHRRFKTARQRREDTILSETRSANGATGMHTEGFRKPVIDRFKKHDSKPHDAAPKLSIRELADLLYDR